jgi:hypothetical protein
MQSRPDRRGKEGSAREQTFAGSRRSRTVANHAPRLGFALRRVRLRVVSGCPWGRAPLSVFGSVSSVTHLGRAPHGAWLPAKENADQRRSFNSLITRRFKPQSAPAHRVHPLHPQSVLNVVERPREAARCAGLSCSWKRSALDQAVKGSALICVLIRRGAMRREEPCRGGVPDMEPYRQRSPAEVRQLDTEPSSKRSPRAGETTRHGAVQGRGAMPRRAT